MGASSESTALASRESVTPVVAETASSAVAARERAAVEARFVMAARFPRNYDLARTRLLARAESPRFAEVAQYAKPVGGKKVHGASIRMMEEVARQFGNIDLQAPVVFDDATRRIVRVSATDLESNYTASVDVILEKTVERKNPRQGDEVLGSRANSQGDTVYLIRADEDAFLVKQNANVSKARRECIRAVVPGDLVEEAMERCADTRRSEVKKDPAAARNRIADSFYALGVMPNQLCEFLNKPSLEAVTEAEVELLRAIYSAMKEGEATWADVMDEKRGSAHAAADGAPAMNAGKGAAGLRERLAQRANGGAAAQTATAGPVDSPAAGVAAQPVAQTDEEIRAEEQAMLDREKKKGGR